MCRLIPAAAVVTLLMVAACGGDSAGPGGDAEPNGDGNATGNLSGVVRSAVPSALLEGAIVSVGMRQATTDASGRYQLTGLPPGTATVRAQRPGYVSAETSVTITAGNNTRDFALAVQEIYQSGSHAVYVPAGVGPMRGVIIALGGPVTAGFVTGERIAPADNHALETSLQDLGASLRALAQSAHVALLGSAIVGMESSSTSDAALLGALNAVATASGHPELASARVLMFGLSAGAREAAGIVSRNPGRSIALLVRVPVTVEDLTSPAALAVPTFVMQAELDNVVNNPAVAATFAQNRSRGGLWALAVEPRAAHNVATELGNDVVLEWISTALTRRLPATAGAPLVDLDPASGWLGNQLNLAIATWADYPDDRSAASWLLSQAVASSWQRLGTPPEN